MYEINLMVLMHQFISHGIRLIAEIVGMFSTDLYALRRKKGILAMIHGRQSVFFCYRPSTKVDGFLAMRY